MSKCHIVGNIMSRLICDSVLYFRLFTAFPLPSVKMKKHIKKTLLVSRNSAQNADNKGDAVLRREISLKVICEKAKFSKTEFCNILRDNE